MVAGLISSRSEQGRAREAVRQFALKTPGIETPIRWPEQLLPAAEVCRSFALDNGAFSLWRARDTESLPEDGPGRSVAGLRLKSGVARCAG